MTTVTSAVRYGSTSTAVGAGVAFEWGVPTGVPLGPVVCKRDIAGVGADEDGGVGWTAGVTQFVGATGAGADVMAIELGGKDSVGLTVAQPRSARPINASAKRKVRPH